MEWLTEGASESSPYQWGRERTQLHYLKKHKEMYGFMLGSVDFRHSWVQVLTQSLQTSVSLQRLALAFLCLCLPLGQSVFVWWLQRLRAKILPERELLFPSGYYKSPLVGS